MKLIVGLGNPDSKYKNTRHNVGFMVLDAFLKEKGYSLTLKKEFRGNVYISKDFILLEPITYMNLSGDAVQLVAKYYKIDPEDILIISDDFNLPLLKLRLRQKGSAGGHNGLKSIIACLNSENFKRVRVGLGEPSKEIVDYVLSKFSKEELKRFESELYPRTNEIISRFINGENFDLIMNQFNQNESL